MNHEYMTIMKRISQLRTSQLKTSQLMTTNLRGSNVNKDDDIILFER